MRSAEVEPDAPTVTNGTVVNVAEGTVTGPNWRPCPDDVAIGWRFDGITFTFAPPPPVPETDDEKRRGIRIMAKTKIIEMADDDEGFFNTFAFMFISRKLHDGGTKNATEQSLWDSRLIPWFADGKDIFQAAMVLLQTLPDDWRDPSHWPVV